LADRIGDFCMDATASTQSIYPLTCLLLKKIGYIFP
jgi:hypothetical protein